MKYVYKFMLVLCIVKLHECLPHNSTVLSSKYAKVAVWGTNNSSEDVEGRNSKNSGIWNRRLDAKSIGLNTKKKNPSVAYQYPVYQGPESKIDKNVEHVPGIGEVIIAQDRFEARPLFAYRNKQQLSGSYGAPAAPTRGSPVTSSPPRPPPAPQPASPPITRPQTPSFSSFNNPPPASPPISDSNPSGDLYNSPYTSYNPPDVKPDNSDNDAFYPPNLPPNDNSAAPAPSMADSSASTESAKANEPDSYASLGPPLVSYKGDEDHHGPPSLDSHDYQDHSPPHDHSQPFDSMSMYKNNGGPPNFPPKSEDDIYYPPDFPRDQVPQPDMKDNGSDMTNSHPESGQAIGDMAPPAPSDYDHGHAFPQYLYDQHHYDHDHHVYEEIPHTTEPVKEKKRVSSTHYSYYYLGRKLWYIPLYFSVYFILYVTVLILKSIARHKVHFKYKWYEHDYTAKQSRSLDLDAAKEEKIADVHHNVSAALNNVTKKYGRDLAM